MATREFLDGFGPDRGLARTPVKASPVESSGPEAELLRPSGSMDAASVLRLQRSVGNAGTAALLRRAGSEEDALQREPEPDQSSPVHSTIASPGSALDRGTRSTMEQQLGADFSNVRLHVDARSAESVAAAAYTVGDDIVVHPDHFSPGTPQAQRTLAHELTHVKQQRSGPVAGTPQAGGVRVSDPGDHFEQEAEHSAASVMSRLDHGPHAEEDEHV